METTLSYWGNSLGLRIPHALVKQLGLAPGDSVDVALDDGKLVIRPHHRTLDQILADVTDENRHDLIEPSSPVGGEVW